MVAVPFLIPFTTPFEDTVATFLLEEYHFTLPFGVVVTFSVTFFPFFIEADDLFSLTVGFLTVILQVFPTPFEVTVIVTVPAFLAVITPLALIVATDLFLEE